MDTTRIPKPHFSVSTKCSFHLGFSLAPAGIAIGGSIIAYRTGFPLNIPLALATLALTVAWLLLVVSLARWTSDHGRTWRQQHPPARQRLDHPETPPSPQPRQSPPARQRKCPPESHRMPQKGPNAPLHTLEPETRGKGRKIAN